MKHTTICIISAICIMSIFMCSSISHAATSDTTRFTITTVNQNSNTANAELINQILPSTEDNRSNTTAIYEVNLNPMIQVSMVDGYLNGYVRYLLSCTVGSISQGVWYVDNWDISVNQSDFNSFYHSMRYRTANSYDGIVYFDNYWPIGGTASNVTFGTLTIRVTLHDLQGSYPPASIPINVNGTIETAYYNFSANPVSQNQGGVIKQAITDALSQFDIDSVYSLLNLWKTTQDLYLADIELSVDDIEQWLSYINSVQVSQDQKLDLIRQLISTFPTYSSQILQYIQQIINMNASQEAQQQIIESQYQNKENISASLSDGMNTPMPSVGNVGVGGYIDVGTQNSFNGFISLIASNGFIIKMFLIAITLGIVSYALYGKKG